MKLFLRILLIVTVVITLLACASSGRQFDRTHVNDIKKGVQTKAQIKEWFGEPYQVTTPLQGHPAGCVERWMYSYAYSSHGGARTTSATLVVDFDSNGKVCDNAYSEIK